MDFSSLMFYEGKKALLDSEGKPFFIDFLEGRIGYRWKNPHQGMYQNLLKAVGYRRGKSLEIWDLTAGWGEDGFLLAYMGCSVTLCERSPVVGELLEDALHRLRQVMSLKLSLYRGESKVYLETHGKNPDVIYLDPMFPEREKSALVKKNKRVLREIVGGDEDCHDLLNLSLARKCKRVVVKRPRKSPWIGNKKPHYTLEGQRNRFDIYLSF